MIIARSSQGAAGNVAHGIQAVGFQLPGVASPYPPEIGEGPVIPQVAAVAHLIQLRDTHAIRIRLDVFGPDVHGDLAEVEVRADARRSGDAGGFQHVQDDPCSQFTGGELGSW